MIQIELKKSVFIPIGYRHYTAFLGLIYNSHWYKIKKLALFSTSLFSFNFLIFIC